MNTENWIEKTTGYHIMKKREEKTIFKAIFVRVAEATQSLHELNKQNKRNRKKKNPFAHTHFLNGK